jgi:hypothetical protein
MSFKDIKADIELISALESRIADMNQAMLSVEYDEKIRVLIDNKWITFDHYAHELLLEMLYKLKEAYFVEMEQIKKGLT